MSLALVAALALSPTAAIARCSWDSPGANAYVGPVPAAVDRYTDIPVEVRERLKQRMERRDFDEMATIRRDSITGRHRYNSDIRDMHFGSGQVCRSVTRSKWAPEAVERGLVYCEAEHCIIVPTVCRNVSRVTRVPGPGEEAAAGGTDVLPGALLAMDPPGAGQPEGTAGPLAALDNGGAETLTFDPPGAGNSFTEATQVLDPGFVLLPAGGGSAVPAAPVVAGLPGGGTGEPGTVSTPGGQPLGTQPGGGSGGGSALDPPPGVLPIGGGSVGGGGVPAPPPAPVPPIIEIDEIPPIPEPATWMLWLGGLAGLTWLARRRQRG